MDNRDEEMYDGMYMDDEQDSPVVYSKAERMKLTTFIIIVAVLSFILIFLTGMEKHGKLTIQASGKGEVQAFIVNNTVPDTGSIVQEQR